MYLCVVPTPPEPEDFSLLFDAYVHAHAHVVPVEVSASQPLGELRIQVAAAAVRRTTQYILFIDVKRCDKMTCRKFICFIVIELLI